MGTIFSSPSNPTSEPQPPSPAPSSRPTMSSPSQQPKTLEQDSNKLEKDNEENSQEEEEEGECGFCVFMKGGGCKEAFINWENCVMESENKSEDIVEKCHEVTFQLKKCMEAHADYYEPILKAEKAAEEEVAKEMEKEKLLQQSGDENASEIGGEVDPPTKNWDFSTVRS